MQLEGQTNSDLEVNAVRPHIQIGLIQRAARQSRQLRCLFHKHDYTSTQ